MKGISNQQLTLVIPTRSEESHQVFCNFWWDLSLHTRWHRSRTITLQHIEARARIVHYTTICKDYSSILWCQGWRPGINDAILKKQCYRNINEQLLKHTANLCIVDAQLSVVNSQTNSPKHRRCGLCKLTCAFPAHYDFQNGVCLMKSTFS